MFVSKQRVAVTIDGSNIIYIKPKMGYGSRQRLISAVAQMQARADGTLDGTLDLGAANLALLVENIVGWEGPEFEDEKGRVVPCNARTIEDLDEDSPLLDRVLNEINRRNPQKDAGPGAKDDPVPNLPSAGSSGSKGS